MTGPRKTPRHERDYYPTPLWVTEAVLSQMYMLTPGYDTIYDPHAGARHILRAVSEHYERLDGPPWTLPLPRVIAADIEPQRDDIVRADTITETARIDEITIAGPYALRGRTLVICNPPYARAREALATIRRSMPDAHLVALVPLALLGGIKSHDVWRDIGMPDWMRIVAPRPKFVADGAGAPYDVAWYGWGAPIIGGPIGRVEREAK